VPLRTPLPVLLEFLSRISSEFRYRFSDGSFSTLSFWRISPPLIRKILAIYTNAIGSEPDIFVEINDFLWKRNLSADASIDSARGVLWIT